jgi:MFS family permease
MFVRTRSVALANAANLLFSCSFASMVLGTVLFLTGVWHHSVLQAGLEVAPGPAMAALFALPGGVLGDRYGQRVIGTIGALLFAAGGIWRLAFLGPSPDYAGDLLPAMLVGGAAVGLVLPTVSAAATIPLPPQRFATGSGVLGVSRGIGSALGVAILIAVLGDRPESATAFHGAWWLLIVGACAAAGLLATLGRVHRYTIARAGVTPPAGAVPATAATGSP